NTSATLPAVPIQSTGNRTPVSPRFSALSAPRMTGNSLGGGEERSTTCIVISGIAAYLDTTNAAAGCRDDAPASAVFPGYTAGAMNALMPIAAASKHS